MQAAGKNVLFISRQRLLGATNGSSTYLIDLARAVRAAGMVPHLLQPSPTIAGRTPLLTLRQEMDVFETHQVRGLVRIGRHFVSPRPAVYAAVLRAGVSAVARRFGLKGGWTADRKLPYSVAIPWTAADHAWLARESRGKGDIAIADYMFCAEGLRSLPDPAVPSAIVMHDLFHSREGKGADSVALVTREEEIAMLARADAVIAIQATEADFVRLHVPDTLALLAPMASASVAAPRPGIAERLLFVGSDTAPNSVGLRWFFDHVWPSVHAAWPAARLDIAGTVARAFPDGGPQGVRFLGLVDDLAPLYANAGIVISPLTFGSGLKIKLVEALAQGKAIVATPVTLQGIERECAGAVDCTDDPATFADHIVALRDDAPRAARAAAALDVARRYFSAAACYRDFTAWLQRPDAASPPPHAD